MPHKVLGHGARGPRSADWTNRHSSQVMQLVQRQEMNLCGSNSISKKTLSVLCIESQLSVNSDA